MDFGEVLGRAWRIIWKHKILWIFGIFAGCSRGGGGGGGGNSASRFTTPNTGPAPFSEWQQFSTEFATWIQNHWWVVVLFIILILVIIVISLWLGTMGRIGLIKGTFKADTGAERLGFGELWSESTPFFWRIFLLSLLVGLAFLIVVVPVVILGLVFGTLTLGVGFLCILPFICILAIVAIAVGLLVHMAEPAMVLENLGIIEGLRRGWEVFKANIGPVLIIWLILAVIAVVAGLVIALPVLIVLVPAFVAFIAGNAQGGNISYTPLILAGLCFVAYLPVLWVLNGILTAYVQSVWTLTFMRLTRPKEAAEAPLIQAPNA